MTDFGRIEVDRLRPGRRLAAACALLALGWCVILASRFPFALTHGFGNVAGIVVYGVLLALAGINLARHAAGRPLLGKPRSVWQEWIIANLLLTIVLRWELRWPYGAMMGAALGCISLGWIGGLLDRPARAAKPRVAADGAAPRR